MHTQFSYYIEEQFHIDQRSLTFVIATVVVTYQSAVCTSLQDVLYPTLNAYFLVGDLL